MIKTRLTLWNSVVFGLALILIGLIVYGTTYVQLYRAIDRDLERRADFATRNPHPGGPPGPPPGPAFDRPPPPPEFSRLEALDPTQARRLEFEATISRPRFMWRDGGPPPGRPNDRPFDPAAMQASLRGETSVDTVFVEGHWLRVCSAPLTNRGQIVGAAQLASDLSGANQVMDQLRTTLFALVPLALVATSLLGAWMTDRALRPVKRIADAAEAIETADLSNRLPVQGVDEFAHLSTCFNRMIERIQTAFLELEERNAAQRRFIGDASHELKTPLTVIKGRAGMALGSKQTSERYQDHLRAIEKAADSMNGIVRSLLLLARADEGKLPVRREGAFAGDLIAEAVGAVDNPNGFDLELAVPDGLCLHCDPALVQRALTNLLSNAIRHNDKGRPIRISAEPKDGGVQFSVTDEGEGMSSDTVAHAFDRFYRADESRDRASGGVGLGLAIVKSVAEAHGGTVDISSHLGSGVTAQFWIPAQ